MPGPPHRLALTREPDGFWIRRPFQVQPVVQIRDRGDNLVVGSTLPVTVAVITTSETELWNDNSVLNAVGGIVHFADLPCRRCVGLEKMGIAIKERGYSIHLQFSTEYGVQEVSSRKFDMGTWPPHSMILSNYPGIAGRPSPEAGRTFDLQPSIQLADIDGILATWEPGENISIAVTLRSLNALIPNSMQGTTMIQISRGVAQFTDLRHDYMAQVYTMKFSLISSTVTTVADLYPPPFDIVNGPPAQLSLGSSYGFPAAIGTQPGDPAAGFTLGTQPVVLVLDSVGNMLWEAQIQVTAHLFTTDNQSVREIGFHDNSTRTAVSCPLFKGKRDCSKCIPTKRIPATCGNTPFTDLRVDTGFKDLILRFSSPGLQSVDSTPFRVPLGSPHALFLEQQPLGFKFNTRSRVLPAVSVKDRGNNTVPHHSDDAFRFVTAELCLKPHARLPTTCFNNAALTGTTRNPASCLINAGLDGIVSSPTVAGTPEGKCVRYCFSCLEVNIAGKTMLLDTSSFCTPEESSSANPPWRTHFAHASHAIIEQMRRQPDKYRNLLTCSTADCNTVAAEPCTYYDDRPASGLKWIEVGAMQGSASLHDKLLGLRLRNPALATALAGKVELSQNEWDAFDIAELRMNHYLVRPDGSYLKPADTVLQISTSPAATPGNIAGKQTIASGVARFTEMKVALVGTNFSIRFCSEPPGLRCVSSDSFEVTEDPVRLQMKEQPGKATPGLPLDAPPVVEFGDMSSTTITWEPDFGFVVNCTLCVLVSPVNDSASVWKCAPDERWLELNSLSICDAEHPDPLQDLLQGTTSQQVIEGRAVFSDLQVDKRGTYKLRFTAGGFISVDSLPFLVNLGQGVKLVILSEAAGIEPGLPFTTQPMVGVADKGGNMVDDEHGTSVNATLLSADGLVDLGLVPSHFVAPSHSIGYHEATQHTRFGVAVFEGLRIDKVGTYVIRYGAASYLSVDSKPIRVVVGIGVKLHIVVRPTGCCARAACNFQAAQDPTCRSTPVVSILDLGDNLVPWHGVRINATVFAKTSSNSSALGLRSFFATSDGEGKAVYTDFGMEKAGHYRIEFRNISPYVWRTRHPDGSWTSKDYWVFTPVETAFSVSGRLSNLFIEVNPSRIIPGAPMEQQPTVIMRDAERFVVDHDWSTSVTASIADRSGASILLGGQNVHRATPPVNSNYSDLGGHVYFSDLRVDLASKCVRMSFSAAILGGGIATVKSLEFNVDVGPYHRITVIEQPGNAALGTPFGIQPSVALTDYGGNIVMDDSKTFVTGLCLCISPSLGLCLRICISLCLCLYL